MSTWTVLLVALGVSADAFAVAVTQGLRMRRPQVRAALTIAVTFGSFQAAMPLAGYLLGSQLERFITELDHWIAFGLLVLIGLRMLREALHGEGEDTARGGYVLAWGPLLALAVATSIDALAVGIGMAFLEINIVAAVALVGVITFAVSLIGVLLGYRAGTRFRRPAELAGGVILILIGFRILQDHLQIL